MPKKYDPPDVRVKAPQMFGILDQCLVLKCTEFCMLEYEEVGPSETFSRDDYIAMASLRGTILGLSDKEVREDIKYV